MMTILPRISGELYAYTAYERTLGVADGRELCGLAGLHGPSSVPYLGLFSTRSSASEASPAAFLLSDGEWVNGEGFSDGPRMSWKV